jgi:tetratricopeptide (TPR) repeat protein
MVTSPIPPKDYEIHDLLGEGTYGAVYRATYRGAGERAVKFFRRGLVDLATMHRELEKLTEVHEHPGVVTLHDHDLLGSQPYYAMSLHAEKIREADGTWRWRGRSLEDQMPALDRKAILPLLREIVAALAYLHRHQIVHCDVKAANILLTDEGHPKLCDFGQSRDSGESHSSLSGTALYASPEQLRGGERIYAWDVYSFGVLAWRLLNRGAYPRDLRGQAAASTASATATATATLPDRTLPDRSIEAGSFFDGEGLAEAVETAPAPQWSRESQWLPREERKIIDRCLKLEAKDRWADLRDVEQAFRSLDEVRRRKKTRRLLGAFATVTIVALAGTAVAGWKWHQVEQAQAATEALYQRTVASEREAVIQKEKAVKSRNQAEEILRYMIGDLRDKLHPLGKTEIVAEVQRQVDRYYENLDVEEGNREQTSARSNAIRRRGEVLQAHGKISEAGIAYGDAVEILRKFNASAPPGSEFVGDLMMPLLQEGDMLEAQGKHADALANYQECVAVMRRVVAAHPHELVHQANLGITLGRVADSLLRSGNPDEAEAIYLDCLANCQRMVELAPTHVSWKRDLAIAMLRVGSMQGRKGNFAGEEKYAKDALKIMREALERDPEDMTNKRILATTLNTTAHLLGRNGDTEETGNYYRESVDLCRELVIWDPEKVEWKWDLSNALVRMGDFYMRASKPVEAEASYREGLAIDRALVAFDPSSQSTLHNLEFSLERLADVMVDLGKTDESQKLTYEATRVKAKRLLSEDKWSEAAVLSEQLAEAGRDAVQQNPEDFSIQSDLGFLLSQVGECRRKEGKLKEAAIVLDEYLATARLVASSDPANTAWQTDFVTAHSKMGEIEFLLGNIVRANSHYKEALGILQALDSDNRLNASVKQWIFYLEAKVTETNP